MLKFLNLNPEIFGVDINDLSLRIVKLKKKRKGFSLDSFNEVEIKQGVVKEGIIQDQEVLVKIMKEAVTTVKGKSLGTKYVIASLPEEKSFSQVIQMPKMTEEELRTAVPFEAENYIPLTVDKVYLDFQIINSHKDDVNHLDLLINAMPRYIVDSYVISFQKAGLIPCILEVESQAIARALMKKGEGSSPMIFIDFGETKTNLLIFSENSLRFTCSIPISSGQLTQSIADNLSIALDKAEALKIHYGLTEKKERKDHHIAVFMEPILYDLAKQIKKYISFYHSHVSQGYFPSDGKIVKIILCGSGANLKGLLDFLYKELRIPLEIGDPFLNIPLQKTKSSQVIPPSKVLSFTTVLGLAMRGADDTSLYSDSDAL